MAIVLGIQEDIVSFGTFILLIGLPVLFGLSTCVILLISLRRYLVYRIDITERGIFARNNARMQSSTDLLRWEDVRLFAISGSNKPKRTQFYELGNSKAVVRIMYVPHRSLWSLYRPVIPYDEYDRQMQALLSLIAAKTGLPLYDLRSSDPVRFMP